MNASIAEMAQLEGLTLREAPLLEGLNAASRLRYQGFQSLVRSAFERGEQLNSNPGLVWSALCDLRLTAPEPWYESFQSTDTVQIFNRDLEMVFSNFELFRYTSYTVSEILCLPESELWQYEHQSLDAYWQEVQQKGFKAPEMYQEWRVYQFHSPIFRRIERGADRRILAFRPKSITPLKHRDHGKTEALAIVSDSRHVGQVKKPHLKLRIAL